MSNTTKHFIVVVVLICHAGMLAYQACSDSPVWDEVGHFAAGLHYWDHGSFGLFNVNPPLARLVCAFPLLGFDVVRNERSLVWDDAKRSEFLVGGDLISANGDRSFGLFAVARLGTIFFSVLGGLICFEWAKRIYGFQSGICALLLWCFSPNILAHGHLMTPDVPASAMGAIAGYAFYAWVRKPTLCNTGAVAFSLGLAILCKFTLLVLVPLWSLLIAATAHRTASPRRRLALAVGYVLVVLFGSWITILTGYGFERVFRPLGAFTFHSHTFGGDDAPGNIFRGSLMENVPVPFPEYMLRGIDIQKRDFERELWSYLLGTWKQGGWWYYYLVAAGVKVPIGTLMLLAFRAGLFLRHVKRIEWSQHLPLLCGATLFGFVSSQSGFSHHFRYVCPALPFFFIWAAGAMQTKSHQWSVVMWGCVTATIVSSVSVFPHSLAFFNLPSGGPRMGHRYLANSNTDWGQEFLRLKRWVSSRANGQEILLLYDMPEIEPGQFGIVSSTPPVDPRCPRRQLAGDERGPIPGLYCVGVNYLHTFDRRYDYLQEFEPDEWIGYSMVVYDLDVEEVNSVRMQLGLEPVPSITP